MLIVVVVLYKMNYCINTTLSICKNLINYCSEYCFDDANCSCECLSNGIIYNRECAYSKVDLITIGIMIPTFIAIGCIVINICRKNRQSINQSNYQSLQNNDELPKYYEIINITDNTPLPLPAYQEHAQPEQSQAPTITYNCPIPGPGSVPCAITNPGSVPVQENIAYKEI